MFFFFFLPPKPGYYAGSVVSRQACRRLNGTCGIPMTSSSPQRRKQPAWPLNYNTRQRKKKKKDRKAHRGSKEGGKPIQNKVCVNGHIRERRRMHVFTQIVRKTHRILLCSDFFALQCTFTLKKSKWGRRGSGG